MDSRVERMAASKRGRRSWAKGLSSASDERIARNARTRTGRPRGPYDLTRFTVIRTDPISYLGETREADYSYLLGLYLGDGCIVGKMNRLEITLDKRYPLIIETCAASMRRLHPRNRVAIRSHGNAAVVNSYGREWQLLFPQHGRGRKHLRLIRLENWQKTIVERHPFALLRGLLESDGCFVRRIVGGREYPAYDFTNESRDIRDIFCQVATRVGLHYTFPAANRVSIAKRRDVTLLAPHVTGKTFAARGDRGNPSR